MKYKPFIGFTINQSKDLYWPTTYQALQCNKCFFNAHMKILWVLKYEVFCQHSKQPNTCASLYSTPWTPGTHRFFRRGVSGSVGKPCGPPEGWMWRVVNQKVLIHHWATKKGAPYSLGNLLGIVGAQLYGDYFNKAWNKDFYWTTRISMECHKGFDHLLHL